MLADHAQKFNNSSGGATYKRKDTVSKIIQLEHFSPSNLTHEHTSNVLHIGKMYGMCVKIG